MFLYKLAVLLMKQLTLLEGVVDSEKKIKTFGSQTPHRQNCIQNIIGRRFTIKQMDGCRKRVQMCMKTLFLGRQDAMQRTSLSPIVKYANDRVSKGEPLKVLEVACGTGRFMTFIRDNLPLNSECTAVDLSPYYLDAARDNDAYWRKMRLQDERLIGRLDPHALAFRPICPSPLSDRSKRPVQPSSKRSNLSSHCFFDSTSSSTNNTTGLLLPLEILCILSRSVVSLHL